jgi:hypothetical protein
VGVIALGREATAHFMVARKSNGAGLTVICFIWI